MNRVTVNRGEAYQARALCHSLRSTDTHCEYHRKEDGTYKIIIEIRENIARQYPRS